MRLNRIFFALNALLIAILACNVPSAPKTAQPDLAGTITAQAVVLQQGPSSTPAPVDTATPAFTATPSVPEVTVSAATNCRTGPGTVYDLIFTMNPGQSAQIVGKDTPDNYWIINNPAGGTCWLWGQYAVVSGNTAPLPDYPAPLTPTPAEPAAPKGLKGSTTCTASGTLFVENVHVDLSWTDVATNEDGYRIFRNDKLLATLGANSTSFGDDTTLTFLIILGKTPPPPPSITYGVEAFNGAGKSNRKEVTVTCK